MYKRQVLGFSPFTTTHAVSYTHLDVYKRQAFLGLIGFADDYIKVFQKNKQGLAGKFKIFGQIVLGLFVAATLFLSDDVLVHENVKSVSGTDLHEIVVDPQTGEQKLQKVAMDIKSTKTTLPFIKKNEFDYAWLVAVSYTHLDVYKRQMWKR